MYKVVQIWPGRFVCKQVTVCPGHIWTTLYFGSVMSCALQKLITDMQIGLAYIYNAITNVAKTNLSVCLNEMLSMLSVVLEVKLHV
jgi:hypothetical protein